MRVSVANDLFIVSSLKQQAGFYQQPLNNVSSYHSLGNHLIREAESALCFRRLDKLKEIAELLINMSIEEYWTAGQFYLGLHALRNGENSTEIFNQFIEHSGIYKSRAFIALASIEARRGMYETELGYYLEALKYSSNISTRISALRGIALVKAKEGYHRQSLRDLETLRPLAQRAGSFIYCDYLNSLAVELNEAGSVQPAQYISQIVLASPYASAYPEWHETSREVELRGYRTSRSFVSLSQRNLNPDNVLRLPMPELSGSSLSIGVAFQHSQQPARVLNYSEFKKKMVKEPNGTPNDKKSSKDTTERELFFQLVEIVSKKEFTKEQLHRLIEYAERIASKPYSESDED